MPITTFPFFFSSLFLWRYFLECFKVHKKIEKKAHRSNPCALCPDTCIAFCMISISQQVVHLFQLMKRHWHTLSLWFTLGVTLAVVHCVHLDKCILTYINHHSIIQGIFRALKMFSLLPVRPQPSKPLATTDFLIVFLVLLFPECHRVELTQWIAFSDWFLILRVRI